jgi:hypothetical protein
MKSQAGLKRFAAIQRLSAKDILFMGNAKSDAIGSPEAGLLVMTDKAARGLGFDALLESFHNSPMTLAVKGQVPVVVVEDCGCTVEGLQVRERLLHAIKREG